MAWGVPYEKFVQEWSEGVHASAQPDLIPDNASPRALNASWDAVGDGSAIVRQRRGLQKFTTSVIGSLTNPIIGQAFFQKRETSGAFTNHHLAVGQGGELVVVAGNGVLASVSSVIFNGVPANMSYVVANNRVYIVVGSPIHVDGVPGNGLVYDGVSWTKLGIAGPVEMLAVTPTGSGEMTGTYDVAITFYNETKGIESSRCVETTVVCTAQQIQVMWDFPPDPQVTHVRIYLRKQEISTGFYKAAEIPVNVALGIGASGTIDISDDEYNGLITEAPGTTDHEPLPDGVKYLAWWRNRLFAATDREVYYSDSESAEAFDVGIFEDPGKDDGQKITAMLVAQDALVILKEDSVYRISGTGPNDWVVELISPTAGCVAPKSVLYTDGNAYWWSARGPVVWTGDGEPMRLGAAFISDLISSDVLNYSLLGQIQGVHDIKNERIIWAVPEVGRAQNTLMLPYKYRLGRFEGQWYAIDVASFLAAEDSIGQPLVFIGGYYGHIFRWWAGDNDGTPTNGTASASFTAAAAAMTEILSTDPGADPTVWTGLYLYVLGPNGESFPRRRIVSWNGSTGAHVLDAPLKGLIVGSVYTWQIGAIDFQFDLKWQNDGMPFMKKRYEFLYTQVKSPAATTLYADISYDYSEAEPHSRVLTVTPGTTGGLGHGGPDAQADTGRPHGAGLARAVPPPAPEHPVRTFEDWNAWRVPHGQAVETSRRRPRSTWTGCRWRSSARTTWRPTSCTRCSSTRRRTGIRSSSTG